MTGRAFWLWAAAGLAFAQEPFNNAALSGKYHFVQLLAAGPAGETRTLAGTITFDGGTYSVGAAGNVALVSPIRSTEYVSAYLSGDREALVGASAFARGTTYDLFVAVRAPAADVSSGLLNGTYAGAWLELATPVMKSGLAWLTADGNGRFSRVVISGHASDQGGRTLSQSAANATYNLKSGGTGTASFGTTASLLAGEREIFVSRDGAYLVGHLPGRGLLLAVRQGSGSGTLQGRYWMAELQVDGPDWSAASGSLQALERGRALVAERVRMNGNLVDYAGLNAYAVDADGTGALAPRLIPRLTNMTLGGGGFVGAQMGPPEASTTQYGIFVGVRAPVLRGSGVFLDPAGVVNGAAFAGIPYPVAPGTIVSLFGSGLAAREARAAAHPLPVRLDDVEVTITEAPAPLYFVSPAQVSLQIPYGLKGTAVALRARNSRGASNTVAATLAETTPGVFYCADSQNPFRACVLHGDFSPVSSQSPARPGETVMIWLTGLGELRPGVATGAANPASPLAWAFGGPISVLFGGEPAARTDYVGGAPGFAGLNQINATIPVSVPVGANVPVAILTGNAYADLADIPISR